MTSQVKRELTYLIQLRVGMGLWKSQLLACLAIMFSIGYKDYRSAAQNGQENCVK